MPGINDIHFTMETHGDVICLTDLGTGYSITNGAELVINELYRLLGDLSKWRIIYRDTDGWWDGLGEHDGRFTDYIALGGYTDREQAIAAARLHKHWDRKPRDDRWG